NSSVVRVTLLADKIEVDTVYGKLSVPVRDIRRIEFGMRLPEGADKKIETAIKQLASTEYKEREAAVRDLVDLGAYAYPALEQAARKGEPEVVKRAQDAIAKIKGKVPAKELRLPEEDKVITPTFTIVGRITASSLRAKTEYFGDVDLSLATLRHMRQLTETRENEIVVDAAKHTQPNGWLDTGITVQNFSTLAIVASGEVDLRPSTPGQLMCGPRGYGRNAGDGPGVAAGGLFPAGGKKKGGAAFSRISPGSLVGRIGENGEMFLIGDRFEGSLGEGKLYLQIMSSPYDTTV